MRIAVTSQNRREITEHAGRCRNFWVFDVEDASAVTALGLHALQHRGQEACGIVSFDGKRFNSERHMGLVGEHFGGDLRQRLADDDSVHASLPAFSPESAGVTNVREDKTELMNRPCANALNA
jgi:hypothetical protein